MDPMQNPTPIPNPVPPVPNPVPGPTPVTPNPVSPNPVPAAPNPVTSNPAPTMPYSAAPDMMSAPVTPMANQVVNTIDTSAFENVTPVSPLSATEPLTQPEPAPAPDPVEEALKAPLKPADPVPGSIGSAVSMNGQAMPNVSNMSSSMGGTPNMPFNDPAAVASTTAPAMVPAKKKSNKTLIILCIIAILIVAGLGVVLAMQMLTPTTPQSKPNNNSNSKVEEEEDKKEEPVAVASMLSCTRTLAAADLAKYEGATSGVETLVANYDNNVLDSIKISLSLVFPDDTSAKTGLTTAKANYMEEYKALSLDTDPFNSSYDQVNGKVTVAHEASLTVLDEKNSKIFNIESDSTEKLDTKSETVQKIYEEMSYVCNADANAMKK